VTTDDVPAGVVLPEVKDPGGGPGSGTENDRVLAALRAGDEAAFGQLIDQHGPLMMRIAQLYVRDRAAADDVVQETWLGVLQGIDRFEGRSSLKTWMFRILTNIARRRARQERRTVPLSSLVEDAGESRAAVPVDRFLGSGDEWPGHWSSFPQRWSALPEERVLSQETFLVAEKSIGSLPPNQRAVIDLRDVHGWTSTEVCELLDISEANQRVLLHRARSKVRRALEDHLTPA
jgi:RNA polymerase sigma-70 factor, ECF subfamily